MTKPTFELAQIVKAYRGIFEAKQSVLKHHLRVLNAIEHCRTAYFGGHVDTCTSCSYERVSYNSCRNRHCPKCQSTNRERWIMAREADVLPTTYFHVVFTIPQELNAYCLRFPKEMYNILFAASKETVMAFGNDSKHLGAEMGAISLLHTWGQNLSLHPHVHCIVPGGGITKAGNWKSVKSDGQYLFPVKGMSQVYKAKFMEQVKAFLESIKQPMSIRMKQNLYSKNWVVYAKQPFAGPKQVIEYLGRYSHKIAISNHRIKSIGNNNIVFSYKDYAHGSTTKLMTLEATEFLRRFCMHILPAQFTKIRHYGILASRNKAKLKTLQQKIGSTKPATAEKIDWKTITKTRLGFDVEACPCCKTGQMIRTKSFDAHAPPMRLNNKLR